MRLIDADKFRSFLDRQYHSCHGYSGNKKEIYREALRAVKSYVHSEGQIDAVPVVWCKDCKYWQDNNSGYPHEECRWGHGETPDANDFCSYGERKEGADKGSISRV